MTCGHVALPLLPVILFQHPFLRAPPHVFFNTYSPPSTPFSATCAPVCARYCLVMLTQWRVPLRARIIMALVCVAEPIATRSSWRGVCWALEGIVPRWRTPSYCYANAMLINIDGPLDASSLGHLCKPYKSVEARSHCIQRRVSFPQQHICVYVRMYVSALL